MNSKQKTVLVNFTIVIVITAITVLAMINLKEIINRSEAMRAMAHLSQNILQYREQYGSIPPESYVNEIQTTLEGRARLGGLYYRARWIDFNCGPDEILAYSERKFHSLFISDGYVVLRLNGQVQWMEQEKFEQLLASQQDLLEITVQNSQP